MMGKALKVFISEKFMRLGSPFTAGWQPPSLGLQSFSYHDRRHAFATDLPLLANYSEKTVVRRTQ
eukprot:2330920-Amphidinium_carterae.1